MVRVCASAVPQPCFFRVKAVSARRQPGVSQVCQNTDHVKYTLLSSRRIGPYCDGLSPSYSRVDERDENEVTGPLCKLAFFQKKEKLFEYLNFMKKFKFEFFI